MDDNQSMIKVIKQTINQSTTNQINKQAVQTIYQSNQTSNNQSIHQCYFNLSIKQSINPIKTINLKLSRVSIWVIYLQGDYLINHISHQCYQSINLAYLIWSRINQRLFSDAIWTVNNLHNQILKINENWFKINQWIQSMQGILNQSKGKKLT